MAMQAIKNGDSLANVGDRYPLSHPKKCTL